MKGIKGLVLIGLIVVLVSVGCVTPKNETPDPPTGCGFCHLDNGAISESNEDMILEVRI